jgi:hypothetical protein
MRNVSFYKELQAKARLHNWNDHVICLKLGEQLNLIGGENLINLTSTECLAVGYYNHCVKHKPMNQRLTNASEILIAIENEYDVEFV